MTRTAERRKEKRKTECIFRDEWRGSATITSENDGKRGEDLFINLESYGIRAELSEYEFCYFCDFLNEIREELCRIQTRKRGR